MGNTILAKRTILLFDGLLAWIFELHVPSIVRMSKSSILQFGLSEDEKAHTNAVEEVAWLTTSIKSGQEIFDH